MEWLGESFPVWAQAITWFITVGIGVVMFKFLDRWLTHKSTTRVDIMSEYENLRNRISELEKQSADRDAKILELTREIGDYKVENALQKMQITSLQDTITMMQARLAAGGDVGCPFLDTAKAETMADKLKEEVKQSRL
jgi:chromosome segregation ATPase